MGCSTNAILAFGIDLGDEYPYSMRDEDDDHIDFEDYVAELLGLTGHWKDPGYFERKKALLEQCPVELEIHCSGDYACYALVLKGKTTTAYRGHPKTIDPATMIVTEEEIKTFKEWCVKLGIDQAEDPDDPPLELDEPAWLIMSYVG